MEGITPDGPVVFSGSLYLEPIPKLSSYKQLYYLPTVQDQDSSHPFFSYLVNNFLNLLCHEFVLSTTHLLAGCFL